MRAVTQFATYENYEIFEPKVAAQNNALYGCLSYRDSTYEISLSLLTANCATAIAHTDLHIRISSDIIWHYYYRINIEAC